MARKIFLAAVLSLGILFVSATSQNVVTSDPAARKAKRVLLQIKAEEAIEPTVEQWIRRYLDRLDPIEIVEDAPDHVLQILAMEFEIKAHRVFVFSTLVLSPFETQRRTITDPTLRDNSRLVCDRYPDLCQLNYHFMLSATQIRDGCRQVVAGVEKYVCNPADSLL